MEKPFVTALDGIAGGVKLIGNADGIIAKIAHLSETAGVVNYGPYASLEMIIPTMESMPTAAMEMPNNAKPSPMGAQSLYAMRAEIAIPIIAGIAEMKP